MKRIAVIAVVAAGLGVVPSVAAAATAPETISGAIVRPMMTRPVSIRPAVIRPIIVRPATSRPSVIRPLPVRELALGVFALHGVNTLHR